MHQTRAGWLWARARAAGNSPFLFGACCHSRLVLGNFLVTQLFSGHFLFKEVRGSSVLEKPRRNYKKRLHLPRPTARTLNGRLSSGPSCWKQGALAPISTLSWWTLRGEPPSPSPRAQQRARTRDELFLSPYIKTPSRHPRAQLKVSPAQYHLLASWPSGRSSTRTQQQQHHLPTRTRWERHQLQRGIRVGAAEAKEGNLSRCQAAPRILLSDPQRQGPARFSQGREGCAGPRKP